MPSAKSTARSLRQPERPSESRNPRFQTAFSHPAQAAAGCAAQPRTCSLPCIFACCSAMPVRDRQAYGRAG
nr:MAG TPA: hypothetical protein [Bacteriophage sp.]